MRAVTLVLAFLAFSGHARRVQTQTRVGHEDAPLAFSLPAGCAGLASRRSSIPQMATNLISVAPPDNYHLCGFPLPTDGTPFALPEVPYKFAQLKGADEGLMRYFYEDAHAYFVAQLNSAVPETSKSLEDLMKASTTGPVALYSAEVYSYNFFWKSLDTNGGGAPTGAIKDYITKSFGSYSKFVDGFREAVDFYGTGWVWLVQKGERLEIVPYVSGSNPLNADAKPILAMNAGSLGGPTFEVEAVVLAFTKNVNWEFANANLDKTAKGVKDLEGMSMDAFLKQLKPSQKKHLDELMAAR